MARKTLREPKIDTELAYAYAKTDRLHDMEDFLGMTNVADILEVGEKCFEDELYQAAKLLFTSISNWARLATTLIYLGENQAAVESARKAGNTQYGSCFYGVSLIVLVYGNKSIRPVSRNPSSAWYVPCLQETPLTTRRHKFVVLTSLFMRYANASTNNTISHEV